LVSIAVRRACVTAIVTIRPTRVAASPRRRQPWYGKSATRHPATASAPATTHGSDGRRSHSAAATPAAVVNHSHHGGR
jgi:hypothetical protein